MRNLTGIFLFLAVSTIAHSQRKLVITADKPVAAVSNIQSGKLMHTLLPYAVNVIKISYTGK